MLPALIHNPNSRRNHRGSKAFLGFARQMLGEHCICSSHGNHLEEYIRRLYREKVDIIAINGGDGTVSACLTAIAAIYPVEALPVIVVFPAGNTNLIAGDVGFGKRGIEGLKILLAAIAQDGQGLKTSLRAPIKCSWVSHDGVAQPIIPEDEAEEGGLLAEEAGRGKMILGMFGGCTGYTRAVRIAHSPTILRFAPHDLAVFFTILTSLVSLLFRKSRQIWLKGNRIFWRSTKNNIAYPIEEGAADSAGKLHRQREGRSFLFIVTSLGKLSHGIWPFWSQEKGDDKAESHIASGFHFLDVHAFPGQLLQATLTLLRGHAPSWLRTHRDYTSDFIEHIEIETDSDFVLDGELFKGQDASRIVLERGPVFRFFHL